MKIYGQIERMNFYVQRLSNRKWFFVLTVAAAASSAEFDLLERRDTIED